MRVGWLSVLVACAAACGDAASRSPIERTDSADVTIVDVAALPPVDAIPTIGDPHASITGPVALMGDMRITAGGDFLIPNHMSPASLLQFDRTGRHVVRIGREGQGPGEFRSPTAVVDMDDGWVLVLDAWQGRWTRFGPEGRVEVGSYPGHLGDPRGVSRSGWALFARTPLTDPAPQGRIDLTTTYVLWHLGEDRTVNLPAAVPVQMHYAHGEGMVVRMEIPWEAASHAAVHDSHVAVTLPSSEEVRVFTTSGELVTILRFNEALDPVGSGEWTAWVDWHVARLPEDLRRIERARLRALPRPRHHRTLGRVILDDRGRLWLERFSPPNEGQAVWDVFSLEGELVHSVRFPDGCILHDVHDGYVLGEMENDLGVSIAVGWRLPF